MNILVIGASGFIGRNIALGCIKKGWKVHGVYNKNKDFIPKKCLSFNISAIDNLRNNYDIVFVAVGNYKSSYNELVETNIKIPLKATKKFTNSRLVFVSSTEVYGVHKGTIEEDSSFNNPNPYGLSKIGGEFIIRSSPNASIVRLTYVYGFGMDGNLFIPKAIKGAKEKKIISVFGDGRRMQNYLYIRDAIEYCIRIGVHKNPGTFLCTAQRSHSNIEVVETIKKKFDKCKISFTRNDSSPSFFFNNKKTSKILAFSARYSLEDGLEDYLANAE